MQNRIIGTLIAAAAMAGRSFQDGFKTLRMQGMAGDNTGSKSSMNGGRRKAGNRHVQRVAAKARNVRRHRAAVRGAK